jgi:ribosomal-protein-alanine N-acetyltransferase
LIEGLTNFKVSRYLAKVPHPYKKKDALWWINNCNKNWRKKKKESYIFNIELKSEKKLIGGIDVHEINYFDSTGDIGYWLNEKYWRKGIISEALIKLIDFAFKKLKINRLTILAYVGNKASNAVAKKFRFKFEGREREAARSLAAKKVYDVNKYSLLRREWPKIKGRLK